MFDVVAKSMIRGFAFVEGVSAEHQIKFGGPMTLMSRIQTVRSTMVSQLMRDSSGRLELSNDFVDFGKVEVVDLATRKVYLLRARSRRPKFEPFGEQLFELEEMKHHVMLYGIEDRHLVMTSGPVSRLHVKSAAPRLVLRDGLVEQGRWPLIGATEPDPESSPRDGFDQGAADDFDDLNNIDLDLDAAN